MTEVGSFIKLHRIEQGMTQEDLAKGIVSMSYLSKIENERTTASSEVIQMLCTRLGIQLDSTKDELIKEKCQRWYQLLLKYEDLTDIKKLYNEIIELINTSHSSSILLFEIHKIRYFLILNKFEDALGQINKLAELSSTFDTLQQYYWFKFRGNFIYLHNEFNEALRLYKQAEELINQLDLSEREIADIQYTIAVTHSKLRNTLEAIEYANKALDIFRKKYNFYRCAHCHIVLGISYRRIRMYEKAIKNYNLAKHLGKLNRNKHTIHLANQNLGYLHSAKGDIHQAILHYQEVVADESLNINARLTAITSLIKAYYSIGNYKQTNESIHEGINILTSAENGDRFQFYQYVIYTYKYVLEEEVQKFEELVIDEFLPYLRDRKDYANLAVYHTMLGKHYEKFGKYKQAMNNYKQANLAYDKLSNI